MRVLRSISIEPLRRRVLGPSRVQLTTVVRPTNDAQWLQTTPYFPRVRAKPSNTPAATPTPKTHASRAGHVTDRATARFPWTAPDVDAALAWCEAHAGSVPGKRAVARSVKWPARDAWVFGVGVGAGLLLGKTFNRQL